MGMPQPAFYIFMCQHRTPPGFPKPCCLTHETQDFLQYLSQRLMQKGIIGTVLPVATGCLGRCSFGPVMMVEPGHYMYVRLTKEKIDKIIDEHIIGGKVVEEYLIEKDAWDSPISPQEMMKMAGAR